MERIPRGNSATLSHTFYVDGVATNPTPDAATVTITRDDGTVLVNAAAATEAGAGIVTYTLTPAQTALLDTLTVSWTATFGGQSQAFTDVVEVVGGFLFSISEARALKPLDNTQYTIAQIINTRTLVEEALEDACGVAFVPRYRRETVSGDGGATVVLSRPRVTAVRSVKHDGVAITDLATVVPSSSGIPYYPSGWTRGYGNYEVAYEHGYPYPPAGATQAALLLAKRYLVQGPIDDRATSMSSEDGVINLSTPGLRGARFGLPTADAFVSAYSMHAGVA